MCVRCVGSGPRRPAAESGQGPSRPEAEAMHDFRAAAALLDPNLGAGPALHQPLAALELLGVAAARGHKIDAGEEETAAEEEEQHVHDVQVAVVVDEAAELGVDEAARADRGHREGRVVHGHHLVVAEVHHGLVEEVGLPDGRHRHQQQRDQRHPPPLAVTPWDALGEPVRQQRRERPAPPAATGRRMGALRAWQRCIGGQAHADADAQRAGAGASKQVVHAPR